MGVGFGFVVIAIGASLLYKGYRGWSWAQFYGVILQGQAAPSSAPASSPAPGAGAGQAAKNVKGG